MIKITDKILKIENCSDLFRPTSTKTRQTGYLNTGTCKIYLFLGL